MKHSRHWTVVLFPLFLSLLFAALPPNVQAQEPAKAQFPDKRPEDGNFNRPVQDETIDISPPGFCWWRVGARGKYSYRLRLLNEAGKETYVSPLINDPVHVPDKVLPPGRYTWTVEALNTAGVLVATRPPHAVHYYREPDSAALGVARRTSGPRVQGASAAAFSQTGTRRNQKNAGHDPERGL